jgi:alpha-ribazole phosphatase
MMELHILRHTKPDFPVNTCYGQTDYPVAATFVDEVKEVRENIASDYDAIISSPLQRCTQLADTLFPDQKIIQPQAMEYHFGDWEGRSWDEIDRHEFDYWMEGYIHRPAPAGESLEIFFQRIKQLFETLYRQYKDQKILLVAHAGVARCGWVWVLDLPLSSFLNIDVSYGELCGFRIAEHKTQHRVLFKYPINKISEPLPSSFTT